jgi:hypothetical protein
MRRNMLQGRFFFPDKSGVGRRQDRLPVHGVGLPSQDFKRHPPGQSADDPGADRGAKYVVDKRGGLLLNVVQGVGLDYDVGHNPKPAPLRNGYGYLVGLRLYGAHCGLKFGGCLRRWCAFHIVRF